MKKLIVSFAFLMPLLVYSQIGAFGVGLRGLSIQSHFKTGIGFTARTSGAVGFGSGNFFFQNKTEFNGIYRYNLSEKFGIYGGIGLRAIIGISLGELSNQTNFDSYYQAPIGLEVFTFKKHPNVSFSFEGIIGPRFYSPFSIGRVGLSPNAQLNIYLKPKNSNRSKTKKF